MATIKELFEVLPPGKQQLVKDLESLINARIAELGEPRRTVRVSFPRGQYDIMVLQVLMFIYDGQGWYTSSGFSNGAVEFILVPKPKE